jgi:predicted RNase H-like HicB family nuclease
MDMVKRASNGKEGYKLSVIIEKEDDMYVSHAIDIGVTSQGHTKEEALANVKEACELYLKHADLEEIRHLSKISKSKRIVASVII